MRTIAALYDSRAEAELARARLMSNVKARSPRIIAKDTAAAIDGLNIAPADADTYRDGLRRGSHLLVAEVPSGASPERIIELLESSVGAGPEDSPEEQGIDTEAGVRVELPSDRQAEQPADTAGQLPHRDIADEEVEPESAQSTVPAMFVPPPPPAAADDADQELRIGKREVARGGARVRAFTREAPVEEEVSLRDEFVDVEKRPCERQLTDAEVEAGGLFRDRVFEIAEMREEPVVTKVAIVREEVIVRKTVKQRSETVRDTVRRTEVEVEDLPSADETGRRLFSDV
jgi:hypothetical protein